MHSISNKYNKIEMRNQIEIINKAIQSIKNQAKEGTLTRLAENISKIEQAISKFEIEGKGFPLLAEKYKKILVPYDGSKYSKRALNEAIKISKRFGAMLYLVMVIQVSLVQPPGMLLGITSTKKSQKTIIKSAKSKIGIILEHEAEWCKRQGVEVCYKVLTGNIADSILRFSRSKKIDLIIIGSQGLSGINRIRTLGSVSRKVSEESLCPVMTVR